MRVKTIYIKDKPKDLERFGNFSTSGSENKKILDYAKMNLSKRNKMQFSK